MAFERVLEPIIRGLLKRPYGILLLGPRQVGKTTLLERVLEPFDPWSIPLSDYSVFQEYLKDGALLTRRAESRIEKLKRGRRLTVFLDEVQKMPRLLDDCQHLYDRHKGLFRPVATGSSARKLRRAGANLLPGRIVVKYLHPLLWEELGIARPDPRWSPLPRRAILNTTVRPAACDDFLLWGALPGILSAPEADRPALLQGYALTYLKEEIQAEALVRSLDGFSRFLELAALESGNTTNYQKLSMDVGLRLNTVKNYYSILVDTLVAIPLEPYLRNARKRLISTPKLYFFDTGVRNAAAGIPLTPATLKLESGRLFEHWVILEMVRRISYFHPAARLYFWRTAAGAEVDLVLDTKKELIPIEIKHTSSAAHLNLKGLTSFMDDYKCRRAFVVGNFRSPERIDRRITALPWRML